MKGDFSKKSFDATKHYRDVNMQQGRVLLDTDWNEQNDITRHRMETETIDTIGIAGAPMHAAGFEIIPVDNAGNPVASNGVDLKISAGRFYSDGLLCENETALFYKTQPDFLGTSLPQQPADVGDYMFYLDVWERHITASEDGTIREVALNGADTTTRTKTVWQVKYKKLTAPVTCLTDLPPDILGPADTLRGKLNAKTEAGSSTGGPCGLVTSGGYKGLANQLYRVEIHKEGTRATATFKWSREDGSVLATWESIDSANNNNLIVKNPGRDDLLGFKSGDWVELIGDTTDLLIKPGVLVRLAKVDGNVLTIDPTSINDPEGTPGTAVSRVFTYKNPRIRRWDMQKDKNLVTDKGEIDLDKSTWIELEDGVKVEFNTGDYLSGDYWLIPARTAEANIEWPFSTPQLPLGIKHHFAKLAVCTLSFSGTTPQWKRESDCRPVFPPITELISLYYVGGNGQEAMPGNILPVSLKVGVANGEWALNGANIQFEILSGGGSLTPANGLVTTALDLESRMNGIATCTWTLGTDTSELKLQVKARLLDDSGNELPNHLPVIFNANYSIATNVAYQPKCDNWAGQTPATVAEALDQLCERKYEGGECCSITVGKEGAEYKTLAKAIFSLAELEKSDISLCLLPGDHDIDEDIDMLQHEIKFRTLRITGAESYISMKAKMLRLIADKIILDGFSLTTGEAVNKPDDPKIILISSQVSIDHCSFFRFGESPAPFVYIDSFRDNSTTAYITNSSFLAFFSLTLADGVQGVIEKNVITFLVLQNKSLDEFKPIGVFWLNIDFKNQLKEQLRNEQGLYKFTDWVLSIRGNKVGAIITDNNWQSPQNMYQNIFVSENIFQLVEGIFISNSFVARHVTVVSNQFLYPVPHDVNRTLAFVLGFRGVITGNMAENRKLVVDALLVQDLVGNEPFLNMLDVKV